MAILAQVDPTRTIGLRNRYATDMKRRFALVKKLIRVTVVDNDALMLGETSPLALQAVPVPPVPPPIPPAATRFDFPTDIQKIPAFMAWLGEMVDAGVLEVFGREGRMIVAHTAWQNVYVNSAYEKGVLSADVNLRRVGLEVPDVSMARMFMQPRHADTLGILFTRNFSELQGVTDAMSQQISRVLTQGLVEGIGPDQMGRNMADRVDAIGRSRGVLIARTEVASAHSEATLNRYEDFGIAEVAGKAEFLTAQDGAVCDLCSSLEGQVFAIADARGIIPVHPRCRCTWLPVVPER